jgi:protein-tyrosine phosphatase
VILVGLFVFFMVRKPKVIKAMFEPNDKKQKNSNPNPNPNPTKKLIGNIMNTFHHNDDDDNNHHEHHSTTPSPVVVDVHSAQEIIPRVWLGSRKVALNQDWIKEHNITHVLNIGSDPVLEGERVSNVSYLRWEISDSPDADIQSLFLPVSEVMHKVLATTTTTTGSLTARILLHCHMGISRSCTILCAYLMQVIPLMTATEALEYVKRIRPMVDPNIGFRHQLIQFQQSLSTSSSSLVK